MKETTENGKLKQTRLIFTPKESGTITGSKRHHPEGGGMISPNEFREEE
jgi:hypothetical protein